MQTEHEVRTCEVRGCAKPHKAKDLCHMHYARWKRNGHPLKGERVETRLETCTFPNCRNPHSAHGYCLKHRRRWERYGDPWKGEPQPRRHVPAGPILRLLKAHGGLAAVLSNAPIDTGDRQLSRTVEYRRYDKALTRARETGKILERTADELVAMMGEVFSEVA